MNKKELGEAIYNTSHLTGEFRLRSGQITGEYFDKYLFEADPALLSEISEHLRSIIPEGTEVLAGLELGGVPIATAVSLKTGIPAAFVRKKAKEYGTMKLAEGTDLENRNVCIIEDVTTTGGQIIASARELRKIGAIVKYAICVVVRDDEATKNLRAEGIDLRYLFHMKELASR